MSTNKAVRTTRTPYFSAVSHLTEVGNVPAKNVW